MKANPVIPDALDHRLRLMRSGVSHHHDLEVLIGLSEDRRDRPLAEKTVVVVGGNHHRYQRLGLGESQLVVGLGAHLPEAVALQRLPICDRQQHLAHTVRTRGRHRFHCRSQLTELLAQRRLRVDHPGIHGRAQIRELLAQCLV